MRPIDADYLKCEIHKSYSDDLGILDYIDHAPTIELTNNDNVGKCYVDSEGYERCSACLEHEGNMRYFTFCPHCGARLK